MAQHYGTCIIPARAARPKDKAKVENAVLVAQRWILAKLRNRVFFSVSDQNAAIRILLEELNTHPFQKLEGCRRSKFESIDLPSMLSLPTARYELAEWKKATVNIDYHVVFEDIFYSVPYTLIHEKVEIRATATTIEVLHGGERVASHLRSYGPKGSAVTAREHRPRAHQEYGDWPPERLVSWATSIGPHTSELIAAILAKHAHPERAYRSCLGIIRIARTYGNERMENACRRALEIGATSRKSVEAILKNGLDRIITSDESIAPPVVHENIRGGAYFDREDMGSSTCSNMTPISASQNNSDREYVN
jgi:transposase